MTASGGGAIPDRDGPGFVAETAPGASDAPTKHPVDCDNGWISCWNGCDDGYFDGYEDDPLWYDPGDLIPCSACNAKGGWRCGVCEREGVFDHYDVENDLIDACPYCHDEGTPEGCSVCGEVSQRGSTAPEGT